MEPPLPIARRAGWWGVSESWYVRGTAVVLIATLALFIVVILIERALWKRARKRRAPLSDLDPLSMDEAERLYREATPKPYTKEEIERMIQRTKDGPP